MRFYGFGNYYLSSLQQGLQAGHCVSELFVKYQPSNNLEYNTLIDWAKNHKTMVLLNGGNSQNLEFIYDQFTAFSTFGMKLPFVNFYEDDKALNGALTYTAIIVPEYIYNKAQEVKHEIGTLDEMSYWESELIKLMNSYVLAH